MRYEEAYGTGLGILFTMGINVAMKRPMGSRKCFALQCSQTLFYRSCKHLHRRCRVKSLSLSANSPTGDSLLAEHEIT